MKSNLAVGAVVFLRHLMDIANGFYVHLEERNDWPQTKLGTVRQFLHTSKSGPFAGNK